MNGISATDHGAHTDIQILPRYQNGIVLTFL